MRKVFFYIIYIFMFTVFLGFFKKTYAHPNHKHWWDFQSIDTMKYSRDIAREKISEQTFNETIDLQVRQISESGATHVAIATPYDEEFLPYLKRWVAAARKYNLNVWFRGNWSGWEEWFEYPLITREQHLEKTREFIKQNHTLFRNGDIFSPCPECENGGPGDPRLTGDVEGYRQFLVDEYKMTSEQFRNLGLNVKSNYASMNADVARLIMDEKTTQAMGGVVVIDHFVQTPEEVEQDIKELAQLSGGKIILGEFGVPIPDIHGSFNEEQQAQWIEEVLERLIDEEHLLGVNYWVSYGGSTAIWNPNGTRRQTVGVLEKYYKPNTFQANILNELGQPVEGVKVSSEHKTTTTDKKGFFTLNFIERATTINITSDKYRDTIYIIEDTDPHKEIILKLENESLLFKIRKFFYNLKKAQQA